MRKLLIYFFLIVLAFTLVFLSGCSTPCNSRKVKCLVKMELINGKTITKTIVMAERSRIMLTDNMTLFYTRGCSDEFKIYHDEDCAGIHYEKIFDTGYGGTRRYESGNRISLGVVSYTLLKREYVLIKK